MFFVATLIMKPLAPLVKLHDEKIGPRIWQYKSVGHEWVFGKNNRIHCEVCGEQPNMLTLLRMWFDDWPFHQRPWMR